MDLVYVRNNYTVSNSPNRVIRIVHVGYLCNSGMGMDWTDRSRSAYVGVGIFLFSTFLAPGSTKAYAPVGSACPRLTALRIVEYIHSGEFAKMRRFRGTKTYVRPRRTKNRQETVY
jgi:hypothetical protein